MRIINESAIRGFWEKHPDAQAPLRRWLEVSRRAQWRTFQEVRSVFPHADAAQVGSGKIVTVFNVCGNKYRLTVAVHYNTGLVFVLRFMTHAEYSRAAWKASL